ncbi:DUF2079 domain-containing protein [Actinosynnema sp. CS-041913]|uniref:DUF2079 domain-containing protein n=1 Tax=Actinosynnema sp. CS-041913 TaxID=3239917 RepID=UPI003D89DDCB
MLIRTRLTVRPAYAVAVGFLALYTTYSLWRHHAFQSTGYDLGIFEQAVRSYADLRLPTSDLKGRDFPLLGDHFHPIIALLAPFYAVAPRAETLLVAQAFLFAASTIPVTRLAERLGPRGVVVGVAYGFSWGLQNAVAFDFHEICFAVPLLAFAIEALIDEQWRTAVLWAAPLVLVKEDLPVTVAAIGLYLVYRRQYRLGAATVAFGALSFVMILFVLLPPANPTGDYQYWDQLRPSDSELGLLTRLATLLVLLAPTGFLALRSPLVLLALPTLGWRFASGNPAYWGIGYHYSAVLMPIVFGAFLAARPTRVWVCAVVTAAFTVLLPLRPPSPPLWDAAQQAEARRILALIPDDATVAASNRVAPQLTGRCEVSLFPWHTDADYLLVSRPSPGWPVSTDEERRTLETVPHQPIAESAHLVLWKR